MFRDGHFLLLEKKYYTCHCNYNNYNNSNNNALVLYSSFLDIETLLFHVFIHPTPGDVTTNVATADLGQIDRSEAAHLHHVPLRPAPAHTLYIHSGSN